MALVDDVNSGFWLVADDPAAFEVNPLRMTSASFSHAEEFWLVLADEARGRGICSNFQRTKHNTSIYVTEVFIYTPSFLSKLTKGLQSNSSENLRDHSILFQNSTGV